MNWFHCNVNCFIELILISFFERVYFQFPLPLYPLRLPSPHVQSRPIHSRVCRRSDGFLRGDNFLWWHVSDNFFVYFVIQKFILKTDNTNFAHPFVIQRSNDEALVELSFGKADLAGNRTARAALRHHRFVPRSYGEEVCIRELLFLTTEQSL